MNKIIKILRVVIPSVLLGVFFIWLGVKDLTDIQKEEIVSSFKRADYFWIFLSLVVAMISHISRSIRWQYSLDAVDIKTSFWNRYLTLLINYFTNLAIPRAGEVTRCALLSRYEKQPFEKIMGTMIVERLVDLIMLALLMIGFVFFQYDVVYDFLLPKIQSKFSFIGDVSALSFLLLAAFLGGLLFLGLFFFVKKSNSGIAQKIKKIAKGLYEGVMTIFTMEKKGLYLLHTLIIWISYIVMFGVCFKALPETSDVKIITMIAGFVFGTLAMVLTQGGLGAYPLFVMQGLVIYNIAETTAYALGWIIWTSQTVMVIIAGLIAFIVLPLVNRKKEDKGYE